MLITDQQYQRLMKEYQSSGVLAHAAMKAGVDVKTGRKYLQAGQGPEEMKPVHNWRTRGGSGGGDLDRGGEVAGGDAGIGGENAVRALGQ
jgi:hypothetical protein